MAIAIHHVARKHNRHPFPSETTTSRFTARPTSLAGWPSSIWRTVCRMGSCAVGDRRTRPLQAGDHQGDRERNARCADRRSSERNRSAVDAAPPACCPHHCGSTRYLRRTGGRRRSSLQSNRKSFAQLKAQRYIGFDQFLSAAYFLPPAPNEIRDPAVVHTYSPVTPGTNCRRHELEDNVVESNVKKPGFSVRH